jgi:hypothetical protein
MLKGDQIAEANLTDWRKLAQELHARCLVGDFGTGARFVAAVGEAGDALGHHPRVSISNGYDRQPRNLLPGDADAAAAADTPFHLHQAGGGRRGGSGRMGVRQPAQVTRGEGVRQGPEHGAVVCERRPDGMAQG